MGIFDLGYDPLTDGYGNSPNFDIERYQLPSMGSAPVSGSTKSFDDTAPRQAPNWVNAPGTKGYQIDSNMANSLLAQYGVRSTGHINPFENLPDTQFWQNHGRIGAALNGAISAASFAEPSRTVGEGIGVAGRMMAGATQANRQFKTMQMLAPFKVAEANAALQGAADEHTLRQSQAEMYGAHGQYWMNMQKNHFGSQPFADSEGNGQMIDERTGNVVPLRDGQGNPIKLSNKFTMGASTDKTLTERLATMAEQAEAQQNGQTYSGPGSVWGLQKRANWIQQYDTKMAGAKAGAGTSGRNAANANDPNQLSDVDKEQVKTINKQFDEQTLNKNNAANRKQIKRELRRTTGETPKEEEIDATIDTKNAAIETKRQSALGAYLHGRKNGAPAGSNIVDYRNLGKQ
jgi:hypothetical protein